MALYTASESKTGYPSNSNFYLHTHDDYEIYLFLEGDTRYIVEEKVYSLTPAISSSFESMRCTVLTKTVSLPTTGLS